MDNYQVVEAAGVATVAVILASVYFAGVSKGKEMGWDAAWKAKGIYDKKYKPNQRHRAKHIFEQ